RRPHLGAGLRPAHRNRRAGGNQGEPRGSRGVSGRGLMLEIRDLETAYGRSQVLFGVSLDVGASQVVSLLGRNGMGKTTTIKSIMGITPSRSGQISFDGKRISNLPS